MIDGTIARKTNSVSDFGSKIDTAADLVAVSFVKLLPTIHISCHLMGWHNLNYQNWEYHMGIYF